MEVDSAKVREFEDADAFYDWLALNHSSADEVWIKIHKVASGRRSITPKEAIDVALCWGWIDAIRKRFDDQSYLQRYCPRRPKSVWSKINVQNVERLMREGRMTEFGLAQVEAAKADGRWERAYPGASSMPVPEDLLAALAEVPAALAAFEALTAQGRFSITHRLHNMKTEAGRRRRIAAVVEKLAAESG